MLLNVRWTKEIPDLAVHGLVFSPTACGGKNVFRQNASYARNP
jgi:hypothetical protein